MHQPIRATASACPSWRCSMDGARLAAERHPGEAPVACRRLLTGHRRCARRTSVASVSSVSTSSMDSCPAAARRVRGGRRRRRCSGGVEGVEADAFVGGDLLVVGVGDQVQVGDPGRRRRGRLRCFGAGFRVCVAGDLERHRVPVAVVAVADLDVFEVERGEHQLDPPADQGGFDLVGVAVQRHRRGLGDDPLFGPQERLGQRVGRGHHRAVPGRCQPVLPPGQWGLPGLGVDLVVVDGLDPCGEQRVQLQQRGGVGQAAFGQVGGGGVGDLDEELLTHRAEKPLDLPLALGPVRGRVDQADAELAARAQQPRSRRRRCRCRRIRFAGRRGRPGPVAARRPGARCPRRTRTGTRLPAVCDRPGRRTGRSCGRRSSGRATRRRPTARSGRRPRTGRTRACPRRRAHQVAAVEQPQQRRFRGRPPARGPQDPGHLRRGAVRVLPLERDRQLEHLRVDPGAGLACGRDERVEPAGPVAADPPVQGVPGVAQCCPPNGPAWMRGGDRPHHPAAGLRRQPRSPAQGRSAGSGTTPPAAPAPAGSPRRHDQVSHQRNLDSSNEGRSPGTATAPRPNPREDSQPRPPRVRDNSCCPAHRPASPAREADHPNTPPRPATPSPGRAPRPARTGRSPPRSPPPTRPAGPATGSPAPSAPADRPRHDERPARSTPGRFQPPGHPPQPAPHRRRRNRQPRPDPAVPLTTGPRRQRRADHLDRIRAPQQHRHRQQHVRDQTPRAPRPPRPQRPRQPVHRPRPRPPPRTQHRPTTRARQPPGRQPRLDRNLVSLYRHQRVPPCIQHGPPATVLHDMAGGPRRVPRGRFFRPPAQ